MSDLTHINKKGAASMVDVADKSATKRQAIAAAQIKMKPETLAAIKQGNSKKGDVLGTARIAGIMAAKKTAELIPLCHPIGLNNVEIEFVLSDDSITITAKANTIANTGVEMEALTAASIAALTIYDMAKALDRSMVIEKTRLLEKTGGKSGDYKA
jgi:cyclic pyranopterin phosphate synthase